MKHKESKYYKELKRKWREDYWTQTPDNVDVEYKGVELPEELKSMLAEIEDIAKTVVSEYKTEKTDASDITVEVNENSPWLSHTYKWQDSDEEESG